MNPYRKRLLPCLAAFAALVLPPCGLTQLGDLILQDRFEVHPFVFVPDEPIDVLYFCELNYTDTNTLSQNRYYFQFDRNGDVFGGFTLDTGGFVTVTGNYTYAQGELAFESSNGQGADFDLTSTEIYPRLGILGLFRAVGFALGRPGQLGCIAIGHGYDPEPAAYERYVCNDQSTPAGTYSNVIELDAFDSTVGQLIKGAAFRQRDFYASGTTTGDPTLIERNDFGIYRRDRDGVYLDFTRGPLALTFTDWNLTRAERVGNALNISAFEPPLPPCQRAN